MISKYESAFTCFQSFRKFLCSQLVSSHFARNSLQLGTRKMFGMHAKAFAEVVGPQFHVVILIRSLHR